MKQIGVVIPVFNGEKTIEKSIKSLLYQTYKDWVAIIINDGSTDKTKQILKKYIGDDRFHIVHFKENKGRPYARQKGLEIVKELKLRYMCMLDADDWYYPKKLEFQIEFMENHPDITLLSSAIGVANKEKELLSVIKPYEQKKFIKFNNLLSYKMIPHASSIVRVSHLDSNLKYDERLKLSQDQDFLRRLLINRSHAFDPAIQYVYNREESFSFNKYILSKKFTFKSLHSNNAPNGSLIIFTLVSFLKIFYVLLLKLTNNIQKLNKNLGREPENDEINKYTENLKLTHFE